jgi:hypothetical protein
MTLPSVTRIIAPWSGLERIRPDVLEQAAARGTAVHDACATIARGGWPVVAPEEQGYVDSFLRWFARVAAVYAVEEEIRDEALGFMGHPDLIVQWEGQLTLWDLKTPRVASRSWQVQLAAYRHLLCHHIDPPERTAALMLDPSGGVPKAIDLQDPARAFAAFLGALTAYNFFQGGKEHD